MPTRTHVEAAQKLIDIALASSRARKYEESRTLIRLALHFLLEDRLDQETEDSFANLSVWDSLSPTPKRLQGWSDDFNKSLDDLNDNEQSVDYISTMKSFFDHDLVSVAERENCYDEVTDLIDRLVGQEVERESESGNRILSTSEVAKMLGVTSQTVLTWCKTGRMPGAYQTPGGTWKIPGKALSRIERLLSASSELDAYILDQESVNEAVSMRRGDWKK